MCSPEKAVNVEMDELFSPLGLKASLILPPDDPHRLPLQRQYVFNLVNLYSLTVFTLCAALKHPSLQNICAAMNLIYRKQNRIKDKIGGGEEVLDV